MALYQVSRAENYPFLTLKPVREDDPPSDDYVEISGDDFQDYEDTVRSFAKWQGRLAST